MSNGRRVTLQPTAPGNVREGDTVPYKLTVFARPLKSGAEVARIEVRVNGTVTLDDVAFDFTSRNRVVEFGIFLDELDQSWLKIRGNYTGRGFKCTQM